ncbi:cytidine deaminase [Cryomorphaceae bacterium]|nr:cytidine deaminase [Cryomorphaceae bacterium]
MKSFEWTARFVEYDTPEELPEEIHALMLRAEEAREKAYAPYSHFKVGAAVLLEDGVVVTGNNQENGAFPSGLCAERVALFAAGAEHPAVKAEALFITARAVDHDLSEPVAPCGACRQVMAETEQSQGHPMRVFFHGTTGRILEADSVEALLPFTFKFRDWE